MVYAIQYDIGVCDVSTTDPVVPIDFILIGSLTSVGVLIIIATIIGCIR